MISCFGVILTAGYMLWTIQRVYLGPEKPEYKAFPEVDGREISGFLYRPPARFGGRALSAK